VFRVNHGGRCRQPFGLSGDMQGERRFAARFRAEHFNDAATRDALAASAMSSDKRRSEFQKSPGPIAAEGMIEPSPNCFQLLQRGSLTCRYPR